MGRRAGEGKGPPASTAGRSAPTAGGTHVSCASHGPEHAQLAFEVLAVLFLTRLVEPVYGSKEFLKFLLVVDLSINVCVLTGVYIYFATSKEDRKGDML